MSICISGLTINCSHLWLYRRFQASTRSSFLTTENPGERQFIYTVHTLFQPTLSSVKLAKENRLESPLTKDTMVSLAEVRDSNKKITDANTPRVAVFIGGTAGIGKAALMELVSCGFPVKVYLIGRDGPKQQSFLDNLRALNKGAEIIFLEGQISLLAEAKRLSNEILKREPSVNLLLLSAGFLPFQGRQGI